MVQEKNTLIYTPDKSEKQTAIILTMLTILINLILLINMLILVKQLTLITNQKIINQKEEKKLKNTGQFLLVALQKLSLQEASYTLVLIKKLTGEESLKSQNVLLNTVYRRPEKKANQKPGFVWSL